MDRSIETDPWNAFLEASPLGQFQQTSHWARVKALDGWQAERVFLNNNDPSSGGLQILWKQSKLGRIGYISKGPVLRNESHDHIHLIMDRLLSTVKKLGLRALILQPPDNSRITEETLTHYQFNRNPIPNVIRATAHITFDAGAASFDTRLKSQTRRDIRIARERGVTVRRGSREDLPIFFDLMYETCRRQKTLPNPARCDLLEALWDEFTPNVTLGLASINDEVLSGILMIAHGTRLTLWKKGSTARSASFHANALLMYEGLRWANDDGFKQFDLVAIDPTIAETLLAGGKLTEQQQRSRDKFHLQMGAQPRMLPPAQLLVVNPLLRRAHEALTLWRPINNFLMNRLGRS